MFCCKAIKFVISGLQKMLILRLSYYVKKKRHRTTGVVDVANNVDRDFRVILLILI